MAFISNQPGTLYSRFPVSFGQLSDEYIEILSGAKLNDKILISDITEYSSHKQIDIN